MNKDINPHYSTQDLKLNAIVCVCFNNVYIWEIQGSITVYFLFLGLEFDIFLHESIACVAYFLYIDLIRRFLKTKPYICGV